MIRLSMKFVVFVVTYAAGVATGLFLHNEDSINNMRREYTHSKSETEQGSEMSVKSTEYSDDPQAVTSKHQTPNDERNAVNDNSSEMDEPTRQESDYDVAVREIEAKNQVVSEMLSKVEGDKAKVGEYLDMIAQVEPSTKDALLMYAGAYTVQCGRAPSAKMLRNALWEDDPFLANAVTWTRLQKLSSTAKDGVEQAMEQLPSIDCRFN